MKSRLAAVVAIAALPAVVTAQTITADQKPLFDAQTAYYGALEAKAKAQAASTAALTGAVPTSPATGATTVKEGAGQAEADMLVVQALIAAAAEIKDAIKSMPGYTATKPIVVFAGSDAPDLSQWLAFTARVKAVEAQMRAATAEADKLPKPAHSGQQVMAVAALAAVSVVTKLAQLAFTDRELGNVPVKASDYQLAVAVAGQFPGRARLFPTRFGLATADLTDDLAGADAAFRALSQGLRQLLASMAGGAGASDDERRKGAAVALDLTTAANNYNDLRRLLDLPVLPVPGAAKPAPSALAAAIAQADAATPAGTGKGDAAKAGDPGRTGDAAAKSAAADTLSLVAVLRQKAIVAALRDGYGVFVATHSAAASYLTRRGLIASLGPMPIKVSGSVVASYAVIDGDDDKVVAAGLVGKLQKLRRLDLVPESLPLPAH